MFMRIDIDNSLLYPYQRKGVEFAWNHHYCIIGDQMGLGKSFQAIVVAAREGGRTLIVVPASLKLSWESEIAKFYPELDYELLSYSMAKKFKDRNFRTIICDEAHYIKTPDSQRTKAVERIVREVKPERLILLSGTIMKNRIIELYMPLYLTSLNPRGTSGLDIRTLFSYESFCYTFSHEVVKYFNGVEVSTYEGVRNVEELKSLLQTRMIRRKAEDVLDLPDKVSKTVPMKASKPPEYDEVMNQFILDEKKTPEFITCKRLMSESKAEFTAKYVVNLLEELDQVIIFSDHIKTVEKISKILNKKKIKSDYISSHRSMEERSSIIKSFQGGRLKVLCATIGVGSTGLNLQNCNTIVFNDFPFVPAELSQAQKRIHRIGQKQRCFYHYIISNEIDRKILELLASKITTIEKVY